MGNLETLESIHSLLCEGEPDFRQYYEDVLYEYACELLQTKYRTQAIRELHGQVQSLEAEVISYWNLWDNGIGLGELQDDYCEVAARHIRVLDLLQSLEV